MSMLIVCGVSEGSVSGIEICQNVDWNVSVIEKTSKTLKREPSVWSAVCGGNKELSMLSVYLCCQKVGRRPVRDMNVFEGTFYHDSYAVMYGTYCLTCVVSV